MKRHYSFFFLIIISLFFSLKSSAEPNNVDKFLDSSVKVINLNSSWEFSQADKDEWLSASVPGTVQSDLINHKLLPDPFYGVNEQKIQWVENKEWIYRTTFILNKEDLNFQSALLSFKGLDTYADIYLNGSLLERTDNMFIAYDIQVKNILREGKNNLMIYFHSPIKHTLPQYYTNGFNYPADNDHNPIRTSIYSRKAPYSYGWDWGIRIVTSGIWRPVTLTLFNNAIIDDIYVHQTKVTEKLAVLDNVVTVNSVDTVIKKAKINLYYSYKDNLPVCVRKDISLSPGKNIIMIPLSIDKPNLWMPNGWGEACMYDFTTEVIVDNKIVSCKKQRIGLRSLKVINEKDEHGESFYFEVNGRPMFAKGANYVPSDIILTNVTKEKYEHLFKEVKESNMNMLRVWGGGVYEDDIFYDLADENGILIWQDFMFACTAYPSDPNFLRRVNEEADYNIKRLRNHASLAMWCGNNEIFEGLKFWGWDNIYKGTNAMNEMWASYDKLFRQLLPKKVKELDPDRFYVHTSPYEANWGRPNTWGTGDSHNWGVWHGRKPFETFESDIPRFMSEFGFQSFPEMKTIASFSEEKDYDINSDVMKTHQKSPIGNEIIKKYMGWDYKIPANFDDFVYVSQVLQADGVRRGIESHRRNRPYCMGTLYWQLNDVWPVVSWSSIDYYGNWKALHYKVKESFSPIIVSAIKEKDKLNLYVVSDKLKGEERGTLNLRLMDFDGKILKNEFVKGNFKSNNSTLFASKDYNDYAKDSINTFLLLTLRDKAGKIIYENTHYFSKTKNQKLPFTNIKSRIKKEDGKYVITLKSDKLVRSLFIEIPLQGVKFSDNFFDLIPGKSKTICITSDKLKKKSDVMITMRSLNEINNNNQ